MSAYGYRPVQCTPGLWKYDNKDTIFFLVLDDFLVQCYSEEDAEHFLYALRQKYTITVDRKAKENIGINLKWDYIKRTVELSIPEYVKKIYIISNTFFPLTQSIRLTRTMLPSMEDLSSTLTQKILQICYLPATVTSSKTFWLHFYTMALHQTTLFWLPSVTSPLNNQKQLTTHPKRSPSS